MITNEEKKSKRSKLKEKLKKFTKGDVIAIILGLLAIICVLLTSKCNTKKSNEEVSTCETSSLRSIRRSANTSSDDTLSYINAIRNYVNNGSIANIAMPSSYVVGDTNAVSVGYDLRVPDYQIKMEASSNNTYYALNLYQGGQQVGTLGTYQYNSTTYNWSVYVPSGVVVTYTNLIVGNDVQLSSSGNMERYFLYYPNASRYTNADVNLFTCTKNISYLPYGSGENAYQSGFKNGINEGRNQVVSNPNDYGLYTSSQYSSYGSERYADGVYDANQTTEDDLSIRNLVFTILEAPAHLFRDMFNFEIFGINVSLIVVFVVAIALIIFVVGIFKRK